MINGSKIIEKQVLLKITPSLNDKKELKLIIKNLIDKINNVIIKRKLEITIELVGSTAKGTYLKDNVDIDIFLLFPINVSRKQLQETGLSIGRFILKNQEECFAEHPYIRGTYNGIKTEIVPCYKIESSSQKLSAVDRTPLHTKYIKKSLSELQKKEVMLFKQFLKGIGCYGAEAEIEGFSGYLCEILIIKYSTFQNLIINAQNWQYGKKLTLIDVKSPNFNTPLVFIDPVDNERNVSSALSKEKFNLFINACKDYIKKPRITFFFPNEIKPWPINKIKKYLNTKEFIGLKIEKPTIISENLYPQVRKAVRSIKNLCERYDFKIKDSSFYINDSIIYMIIFPENKIISETMIHKGPPVKLKKNVDEFLKRWINDPNMINGPFEKDGRLYIEIKREFSNIKDLLKNQVKNLSLGKNIDKIVKKDVIIKDQNELINENLIIFWTNYLDNKKSWEI